MSIFCFWLIIALLFLVLAIFTYVKSKPALKVLGSVPKGEDTIVYRDEEDREKGIGLESILHSFFKWNVFINVIGFILAAIAAAISAISLST